MMKMQSICCGCGGLGHNTIFKIIEEGLAKSEEVICESCNGTGCIEYAVFSPEEAEAILKHCGLDKE